MMDTIITATDTVSVSDVISRLPKQRYKREGSCKRCGWCCLQEDPPCPYLIFEDKKAVCLIYDSPDRPSKCRIYPGNPPIQHEKCGYFFFDRWEKRKVKYGDKL